MSKKKLIDKIKQIDALTNEEKAELIDLVNKQKRYGLVWEEKPEQVEEELREKLPVLIEVKERAIFAEKVTEDSKKELFEEEKEPAKAPNHILIEGDNLHALTVLNYTHSGKIDVMYFDPPYNTGKKDFKYNDSFVDKEDAYRHSKWLSFMNKRLKLAKNLLKETGVVFISIDENEVAQLKMLCDEVFGEGFCVGEFIWHKKYGGGNDNKNLVTEHESVLIYSKTDPNTNQVLKGIELDFDSFADSDMDDLGRYFSANDSILMRGPNSTPDKRPNLCYEIEDPDGNLILPRDGFGTWCYSKNTLKDKLENGELIWKKVKNKWMLYKKQFLYVDEEVRQKKARSILDKRYSVGQTGEASVLIKEILNLEQMFIGAKPLSLIKFILNISLTNNPLILDFFAGTGTTLHATMQLNSEDEGSRQCILVTNNENNIAEEVCYERNKRVIQGYTKPNGDFVEGLKNNNFRYFKTDFVPSNKTEHNRRKLTNASTELLQIKEDCFIDITKQSGFDRKSCCIATNELGKYLVIVYHSRKQHEVTEELCTFIKQIPDLKENVCVYAFCPELEVLVEDFYEVKDLIKAIPLPDSIYNAYRSVFRKLQFNRKPTTKIENGILEENDDDDEDSEELFSDPAGKEGK